MFNAFISTHTSREGSDSSVGQMDRIIYEFQPTLPVREVTFANLLHLLFIFISTHTSREGSDKGQVKVTEKQYYFNPHFP